LEIFALNRLLFLHLKLNQFMPTNFDFVDEALQTDSSVKILISYSLLLLQLEQPKLICKIRVEFSLLYRLNLQIARLQIILLLELFNLWQMGIQVETLWLLLLLLALIYVLQFVVA